MVNMLEDADKLFRFFGLSFGSGETIRQVSLDTKVPYTTLSRLVKRFEKQGLVKLKTVGKSVVCSLNFKNTMVKQHLILAEESYKDFFISKKLLIKKVANVIGENKSSSFSVLLFGSFAAGKEQKSSDLDLLFIADSKSVVKAVISEFKSLEQIYDIEINSLVFTKKQFGEMLRASEENVGRQVLKNHVVLYNPELFWNVVFEVLA